jgi:putative endonuclease
LSHGALAEDFACKWLESRGLRLIQRNYRCRAGELDLVMRDGEELVIAEVKFRRRSDYGHPEETVDARKRRRIISATRHLLLTTEAFTNIDVRFDVVALSGDLSTPEVHWLRDAFTRDG